MKRGMLLLKNVISVVIAAIAVVSIIGLISNLWGFVIPSSEKEQALGMLQNIGNTLNSIDLMQDADLYVYAPAGLYLVTFSNNQAPEGITIINECINKNCTCICDEKCEKKAYCIQISKPLRKDGSNFKQQIPFSASVVNNINEYFLLNLMSETSGESKVIEKRETNPSILVDSSYSLASGERPSPSVSYIVIHHTSGSSFQEAYAALVSKGYSAHYLIDKDGKIYYFVDESRMAYHALGFNEQSIGIELVNTGYSNDKFTDAQYASLNSLLKDITKRWNIPYDNAHIMGHYETLTAKYADGTYRKWDPSPNFEWSRIGLTNHNVIAIAQLPRGYGYA